MHEYPKVSVIIPTYGGSSSLTRAIDSVLSQHYRNFEIIVVDDNNPESDARKKTVSLIQKYSNNEKLIYIKHEKNKNGAAARNTGVHASDAKYICFLDDDDIFLPNKIEKQVFYLENNVNFSACYCWRRQYGKEICCTETGDLSKSMMDLSFTPTTSAIMLTRESYNNIGGFDETYRRHQDFEFLLRYYKKYKIGVVPEILLEFLGNNVDNQLYGKKLYDLKTYFFQQFSETINEISKNDKKYKKKVYAEHFSSACKQLLRKGNFFLAIKMYIEYGIKGGLLFWVRLFDFAIRGIQKKIKRL